jgi:hypothetical protein
MDDTAQKQPSDNTQPPVSLVGQGPLGGAQPPFQPADQTAVSQPQVAPIGSVHKEAELAPVSDFVKLSEAPVVKDREVSEAGVKEVVQTPELTKEHEQIGVKPSAEITPVKIESLSESSRMPMTQVQAAQIAKKNKNIKSSIVWLAILMLKNFKKMHRKLLKKGVS